MQAIASYNADHKMEKKNNSNIRAYSIKDDNNNMNIYRKMRSTDYIPKYYYSHMDFIQFMAAFAIKCVAHRTVIQITIIWLP
jgi:hypothetical protein